MANNYLFVTTTEITKFKAEESEIDAIPLWLQNFQKIFLNTIQKKN